MIIFPAIDLYEGKAVRLYKGDYGNMTVYSSNPPEIGEKFAALGASHIHIVDLEGARDGNTPNLSTVLAIKEASGAFCEIGGGVRSMEVIDRYLGAGIDRVILGTAAIENPKLLSAAAEKYGKRIAVGADIKDGCIAVRGWLEKSSSDAFGFFRMLTELGIDTVICTDISKDGAMQGPALSLYEKLSREFKINITASGGVSCIGDIEKLSALGLYGAIIGKAWYTGAIDLSAAVRIGEGAKP